MASSATGSRPQLLHVTQCGYLRIAGVREARQSLTDLLEDVKTGREVVIPIAGVRSHAWPPSHAAARFPILGVYATAFRGPDPALSQAVLDAAARPPRREADAVAADPVVATRI